MSNLLNKDELIKSLQDLDFEQSAIDSIIAKGEKGGNFEPDEKGEKKEETETIDEAKAEKKKDDEGEEAEDMKKAFNEIMSAKTALDKSMEDFLNKFGNAPGIKTPDTDLSNGAGVEKKEIQKSITDEFEKSFGDKLDVFAKGFESQSKINEELVKSLRNITETVNAIADAPSPMKSIIGNYRNNLLEKGEKTDENGKKIISLGNKEVVEACIEKAIKVTENEEDKTELRATLSDFSIANKVRPVGFNIVKKALDIDFGK